MKQVILSAAVFTLLATGYSCKDKAKETTTDTTTTTTTTVPTEPTTTAPVEVAGDAALRQGVTDATKDISGLTTRVENGIIYLTGSISRDDNMRITQTLSSLNPKSINRDGLTIK